MVATETTTPIVIGERLKNQLWLEAIGIAGDYEKTGNIHRRQELKAQFDAVADLLFAVSGRDRRIKTGTRLVWKNRKSA